MSYPGFCNLSEHRLKDDSNFANINLHNSYANNKINQTFPIKSSFNIDNEPPLFEDNSLLKNNLTNNNHNPLSYNEIVKQNAELAAYDFIC